jgi:hypothetical protein
MHPGSVDVFYQARYTVRAVAVLVLGAGLICAWIV